MKKAFHFLFLIIMTNELFAQTENYKIAINNFQKSYNSEKYIEIFNSFDAKMKEALPADKAEQFLAGLKAQVGKIETTEFINQKGTVATFKTKFEGGIWSVNLSLDTQNKINGFSVRPYKETKAVEESSKTVNALKSYPKEIMELIYVMTKDFPNNTQLSIALIQGGKTSYYGIIKVNDTIKPIENQTKVFEIGSITKVFTSTVLAGLVVDKKLKLTDNINDYYAFKFKDNIKVNFESLANHTSRLPRMPENFVFLDEKNPYKSYGKKEIEDYFKNLLKLESATPSYAYSNLGAGLLGYTLGLSQKTGFQDLLQKRIFDKYKMKNTFMSSQNLNNKLIKGQDEKGEIVANWDFDVLFGAGGILSTTEDLVKFANAQFDTKNKELALTRKPTANVNEKMKIALNWHVIKTDNGQELVWHNGRTGGYTSSMALNIGNKTGVIILSNVSSFNSKMKNIDGLGFELMKQAK